MWTGCPCRGGRSPESRVTSCAEQRHAGDGVQRLLRFRFRPRLMPGVKHTLRTASLAPPCLPAVFVSIEDRNQVEIG